jgi:hypothetical protein
MGDTLFIVEEGRAGIIAVTATKNFPIEVTTFASFLTRPRGITPVPFITICTGSIILRIQYFATTAI